MKDLDENKLVQISMDGLGQPSDAKDQKKINEERTANESHHLISMWTAYHPWGFSYWCRGH